MGIRFLILILFFFTAFCDFSKLVICISDAVRLKFRVCAALYFPSLKGVISAKHLCHTFFIGVCDMICFGFTLFCFLLLQDYFLPFIFSPQVQMIFGVFYALFWMPPGSVLSS